MHLRTNTIPAESVKSVTDGGTEYLVAPVVLATSMELNGGYLPTEEIQKSASDWNGIPAPIGHPEHNGDPVSVNSPNATSPIIGEIRNAEAAANGEKLVGELWINVDEATDAGDDGERVLARLQNGDAVEVSTAYVPGDVVAGNYDGEHRERAVVDIIPDHLAVLVDEVGKCSIADGCGAGAAVAPVANQLYIESSPDSNPEADDAGNAAEDSGSDNTEMTDTEPPTTNKTVAGVSFDGTADGELDESEIPADGFESHYLVDGDTKTQSSYPVVDADGTLRRGNVESAWQLRGHTGHNLKSDLLELNDEFENPPIDTEQNILQRIANALGVTASSPGVPGDDTPADTDVSPSDEPAESGAGPDDAITNTSESMSDKTAELVDNHGFDAENLPAEDTDCFSRIYEQFTANDAAEAEAEESDETETGEQTETTTNADGDGDDDKYVTKDEFEALKDELTEAVAANAQEALEQAKEQEQKASLVDDVIQTNDAYDEDDRDDLMNTPETALEGLVDDTASTPTRGAANYAGQPGAAPSANTDDAAGFPALTANERAAELDDGGD